MATVRRKTVKHHELYPGMDQLRAAQSTPTQTVSRVGTPALRRLVNSRCALRLMERPPTAATAVRSPRDSPIQTSPVLSGLRRHSNAAGFEAAWVE